MDPLDELSINIQSKSFTQKNTSKTTKEKLDSRIKHPNFEEQNNTGVVRLTADLESVHVHVCTCSRYTEPRQIDRQIQMDKQNNRLSADLEFVHVHVCACSRYTESRQIDIINVCQIKQNNFNLMFHSLKPVAINNLK